MTMTSIEEIKLDAIRKAGVGLSVNACPVFDNPADKAVWLTAWYAENDDTDRGQWIKGNKFFSILKAHTRKNKLAYVFMQLDNLQVIVRSSNLSKIEDLFLNVVL